MAEKKITGVDVARYFLSKDPQREIFNTNSILVRENRRFYEGNARLNKYLHLAQNLWIAKTGEKLFVDDLFAFDNGGIVRDVLDHYAVMVHQNTIPELPDSVKEFLDKFYRAFKNADIDELVELSHEDSEWQSKHKGYYIPDQRMDSLAHVDEYREQYADMLTVMELMS